MQCAEHMRVVHPESAGQRWPRSGPFVLSQLRTCICHQREPTPDMYHMSSVRSLVRSVIYNLSHARAIFSSSGV